jgi:hypothetical protein
MNMKTKPRLLNRNKGNYSCTALPALYAMSLGHVLLGEEIAPAPRLLTALSSTTISGYVDTSAIWKIGTGNGGAGVGNPISGGTFPGRSYDGTPKQDGFNLNVAALTLNRAPAGEGWSAGFNATLLFGPDAVGYNPSVGGANSDFSLKDTYVQLRAPVGNGLEIKLGSVTEPIGYEVFESGNNPNYSRSYGYFLEPTQLVGVRANYQLNQVFSLTAGVVNNWLPGVNARPTRAGTPAAESEKTYVGMIGATLPERFGFLKGATLCAGVIDGLAGGARDTTSVYAGGTFPTPIPDMSVGLAYDYRGTKEVGATPSSYAYAAGLYLLYQATQKLKFALRPEYATGSAGSWYTAPAGTVHPRNQLFGLTTTLDYALWANVISRAEFRWDRELTGYGVFGNKDRDALTLALNLIYKF